MHSLILDEDGKVWSFGSNHLEEAQFDNLESAVSEFLNSTSTRTAKVLQEDGGFRLQEVSASETGDPDVIRAGIQTIPASAGLRMERFSIVARD